MASLEEAVALALDHHLAGRAAEAETLYGRILDAVPDHPDTLHLYGLLCAQSGRMERATELLAQAVAQRPDAAEYRVNLAKIHRAAGRAGAAAGEYRAALKLTPASAEVSFILAHLERDLDRPEAALAAFLHTVLLQPDLAEAWLQAGILLRHAGRRADAIDALWRSVRLRPDHVPALHQLGVALQLAEDPAAVAILRQAAALDPLDPQIRLNLGRALGGQERWPEAAVSHAAAAALDPQSPDAWELLGYARWRGRQPDRAARSFRRAVRLAPHRALYWYASAMASMESGDRRWAELATDRALALEPAYVEALGVRGAQLRDRHALAAALKSYDRGVAVSPQAPEPRWNRAQTRLLAGLYREGWDDYEARWRTPGFPTRPRNFAQPLWTGEPPAGRTLLLYEEQGRGDAIQFVRYAPLAAALGAKVIVEAGADLVSLFRSLDGVAQVVASGDPLPPFDLQCPLMSLPRAFATTPDTVPAACPYLRPEPGRVARWRERLAGEGLRVGLIWAGNPRYAGDRDRSPGLAPLLPILQVAGCRFFGMQVGPGREEMDRLPLPPTFTDLGSDFDFADAAAAKVNMDVVISSCTAPVHLAGALGVPVWVLLAHTPEWRWMLDRQDSPWYPTARLFRQPSPGDWRSVAAAVAKALHMEVLRRG